MGSTRDSVQGHVDVENAHPMDSGMDVTEPLIPVAMKAAVPEDGGNNSSQMASGGGISNGGATPPAPDTADAPVDPHPWWAAAFKLTVALTFGAAVWTGGLAAEALANDSLSGEGRRRLMHHNHGHHDHDHHHHHHPHHHHFGSDEDSGSPHVSNIIVGVVVLLTIASLVSAGMLHSLFHCGGGFLGRSYRVFVGLLGVMSVLFFVAGVPVHSFILLTMFVFGRVMLHRRKKRIAFGAANLKVASLAVKEMPWTYRSAIVMGLVQFLWSLVAAIAALGSFIALETVTAPDGTSYRAIHCLDNINIGSIYIDVDHTQMSPVSGQEASSSCTCNGSKISDEACNFSGLGLPLMVVWLCSLVWGCGVIRNVVACTVSGSVASWWFSPTEDPSPVKGAFYRSTSSSFGSLCKAAVVQQTLGVVFGLGQVVLNAIPCASRVLSWMNVGVQYVLDYAIAFVGIYGLSFDQARGRVREMFERRTVTTLANDVIVGIGLSLLAMAAIAVYALMTGVMLFGAVEKLVDEDSMVDASDKDSSDEVDAVEFWSVLGPQIFGVVALVFLISTVLEVVRSGVKAVFVCFVQDPEVLAEKHGHEMHAELNAAWQDMHGESTG